MISILWGWAAASVAAAGTLMCVQAVRHRWTPPPAPGAEDLALADWCRHMHITVITVTGTEFSMNLAAMRNSDASDFRSWNVPVSVTLWSDRYDPADIIPERGKDDRG